MFVTSYDQYKSQSLQFTDFDRRLELSSAYDSRIPSPLFKTVGSLEEGRVWLRDLPSIIDRLEKQWALRLGKPFHKEVSCSWVAPCVRQDNSEVILKIGWPHFEGRDEITGLQFWDGEASVRLLDFDTTSNAMLLEACVPGTSLREYSELEQDEVIASILKRLWRSPDKSHRFRKLEDLISNWQATNTVKRANEAQIGHRNFAEKLLEKLVETSSDRFLLATDLHAGNVLKSQRIAWMMIDPKPFLGDPAYDWTQHLLNCGDRLRSRPVETIASLAKLTDLDPRRIESWLLLRILVERSSDENRFGELHGILSPRVSSYFAIPAMN